MASEAVLWQWVLLLLHMFGLILISWNSSGFEMLFWVAVETIIWKTISVMVSKKQTKKCR